MGPPTRLTFCEVHRVRIGYACNSDRNVEQPIYFLTELIATGKAVPKSKVNDDATDFHCHTLFYHFFTFGFHREKFFFSSLFLEFGML